MRYTLNLDLIDSVPFYRSMYMYTGRLLTIGVDGSTFVQGHTVQTYIATNFVL